MTDDQIHKEVLKVMGWTRHPDRFYCDKIHWRHPKQPGNWGTCDLPPLTLDLMWQAEEMLSGNEELEAQYSKALFEEIASGFTKCLTVSFSMMHATAIQRARAFLKVKTA